MEHEFTPGEYKTRNGRRAIVRFRLQEPNCTQYKLMGEIECDGIWAAASWTLSGTYDAHLPGGTRDLVPPKRYKWFECGVWGLSSLCPQRPSGCGYALRAELDSDGKVNWPTLVVVPVPVDAASLE
jgi:hypothetical protein